MKILFPTDFSNAAENAYIYALHLARVLKATITVVHIYEVLEVHSWIEESTNMSELNDKITLGEFEKYKEQIELLKRIAAENRLTDIEVNYDLKESDHVVPAILQEAKDNHAELIVMGTRGASGLREIFFGSVASKVMESAHCPVFVVPDTANFRGIRKIGMTLDFKEGELSLIEKGLSLAKKLASHLHCIHVDVFDPQKMKVKMEEYKQAFAGEPHISFHTHYELDVEKGILEFMKFNQMDVILMSVHHQSKWKELFSFSIAKRIAYHSDIPLMAFQEQESGE
jgi:nucleotide-binding universal stress UspA family protein